MNAALCGLLWSFFCALWLVIVVLCVLCDLSGDSGSAARARLARAGAPARASPCITRSRRRRTPEIPLELRGRDRLPRQHDALLRIGGRWETVRQDELAIPLALLEEEV